MKNKVKRILSTNLAILSLFFFGGCKDQVEENATIDDIEFWSTYASESVLQDVHGIYDEVKFEPVINVRAIGGETESAQIIMTTADKAVESFNATISDLYCGQDVFDKSNIYIYQENYIFVPSSEYYKLTGNFPDALVPMASSVAVGENSIEENSNQGLYISFKIPEKQKAGVYTGTFSVTVDEEVKKIPVTLTVAQAFIGEETHVKSGFSITNGHGRGELDTTQDIYDAYTQALTDHRLGVAKFTHDFQGTDAEYHLYAQKAVEYCQDNRSVSYYLPYVGNGREDVSNYKVVLSDGTETVYETAHVYRKNDFKKAIRTLFLAALDSGVNVFEKAVFRGVDEPTFNGYTDHQVEILAYSFKQMKSEIIDELLADSSIIKDDFYFELIDGIKGLQHIVTAYKTPTAAYDTQTMEMTYCPTYDHVTGQDYLSAISNTNPDGDVWWYGCNTPTTPYPTTHLGNTLLSPRVTFWMQADYGIDGMLSWATNLYTMQNLDGTNFLEDYYNYSQRILNVPGEGFLFYPGKKYGIDGPLNSMRLEALRDGVEEYEMIYKLKEYYAEKGFGPDSIMGTLYDQMYSITRIYDDINNKTFEDARSKLIDLLVLAQSDANVMITDYKTGRGKEIYEVYCKDGREIQFSDKFDVEEKAVRGGTVYQISCKEENAFVLSTNDNGKELSVSFALTGGEVTFISAETMVANNAIQKDDKYDSGEEISLTLVNGQTINSSEQTAGLKYAQLQIGGATAISKQSFLIQDEFVNTIDKSVTKIELEIYYMGEEEIPVVLTFKGKNGIGSGVATTLKKGLNRVTLDGVKSLAWSQIREFEYLLVEIGNQGDAARSDLYIAGYSIYK